MLIRNVLLIAVAGLIASCGQKEVPQQPSALESQPEDSTPDDINIDGFDLINGTLSGTNGSEVLYVSLPAPNTLGKAGVCTTTRIGPRHFLTAAHCMNNFTPSAINSSYGPILTFKHGQDGLGIGSFRMDLRHSKHINEPGVEFNESNKLANDIGIWVIQPGNTTWSSTFQDPRPDNSYIAGFTFFNIPQAKISATAVTMGQNVTFYGYGCYNTSREHDFKKRFGTNSVSQLFPSDLPTHFVTSSSVNNVPKAQGCKGDSGGPAFSGTGSNYAIVGINSGNDDPEFTETYFARIDGKRHNWIQKRLETPIIDSHATRVFKTLTSVKVYGYKLDAVGANSTKPVLKLKYGSSTSPVYATLQLASVCPAPLTGEAPFVCFSTAGLANVSAHTVGEWIISRKVNIGGSTVTLDSPGRSKVRICGSTNTICNEP